MGRGINMLKHGWNLFRQDDHLKLPPGPMSAHPIRAGGNARGLSISGDRNIVGSIIARMAVDAASVEFMHVRTENRVATELLNTSLQDLLSLEANVDQNAFAFKVDLFYTMFDHGHAAIIPTDMTADPSKSSSVDIKSWRVGRVVAWYPRNVTVEVWDDRDVTTDGEPVNGGLYKQITLPKSQVGIVQNPFYGVMNESNSVLQRLQRKLVDLDLQNDRVGNGKLDIIFQLPYTVRSDKRQAIAEKRRQELAEQLKDDELGIGYIDVSEKVIQLNRPVNSKLLDEIQDLTAQAHAQLGLTPEILNNTASADAVNGYFDRTIEPAATTVALEMKRKFLTKTARTQGQSIEIYRDPLKLIPLSELAEIVDKLLRNAAITANEIRPKIGYFPSKDPAANMLRNPNMPDDDQPGGKPEGGELDVGATE